MDGATQSSGKSLYLPAQWPHPRNQLRSLRRRGPALLHMHADETQSEN